MGSLFGWIRCLIAVDYMFSLGTLFISTMTLESIFFSTNILNDFVQRFSEAVLFLPRYSQTRKNAALESFFPFLMKKFPFEFVIVQIIYYTVIFRYEQESEYLWYVRRYIISALSQFGVLDFFGKQA